MSKASEIVTNLTPTLGAEGARKMALSAVEQKLAENDLGPAPAIEESVILEVIKSLAEAKVVVAEGTTAVQVAASATAAAQAAQAAEVDIDVVVSRMQGTLDGLVKKLDSMIVYVNKSFGTTAQILELMARGISGVDKHVLDGSAQVVEVQKSLAGRQAPRAVTGRVEAAPNLQDQAATAEVSATGKELAHRVFLQREISVEIQKSASLDASAPGTQKERLKRLGEASLMLARPVPAEKIAEHASIQLPV